MEFLKAQKKNLSLNNIYVLLCNKLKGKTNPGKVYEISSSSDSVIYYWG